MRMGRAIVTGALALTVGCTAVSLEGSIYEKRSYICGVRRGVDYIASTSSGYTIYTDGGCRAAQDGELDEKRVYVNYIKRKVWGIPVVITPFGVEQTVLTDRPEIVRRYARREYIPDIDRVVDRTESHVLRNSEDGQRLQDEFKAVKAQVPQS